MNLRSLAVLSMLAELASATVLAAQGPPIRDLPKPSREISDPFSTIIAAREFKPGKLIVSDGAESQVSLVDFANGSKTAIGRKGAGPGEYTIAAALLGLAGDTLWIVDGAGAAARIVSFGPDLKAGTTFTLQLFNQQDSSVVQGAMASDTHGRLFVTQMKFRIGATGPVIPDSMELVWLDPRSGSGSAGGGGRNAARTALGRIRIPQSGKQDIQNQAGHIKVTTPYPGLVPADGWTAFPDGRVAIVRGAGYRVEFILPNGTRPAPTTIAYEHYPVKEEDKAAELDAVRKLAAEQLAMVRKMMPPGTTLDITVTQPSSWPAEYPPLSITGILAAPNGDLWVRRSVPVRLKRERWDQIDKDGKLVARWQLAESTTIVAVGAGAVYTARRDEDDLRYVQRVEVR